MSRGKKKCPYCQRKVDYGTRLVEHGKGEHTCSHCQKVSKITQNFNIWMLLVFCLIGAAFIMVFYFVSAEGIEAAYREDGTGKILMTLFFGETKEIKWILWELVPFIVFFFVSPVFIELTPMKRYMEQTSSIDLSVPTRTSTDKGQRPSSKTRVIPKAQETEFRGAYEDISSSSGTDSTRAFTISGADSKENTTEAEYTDVTTRSTSKSESYSSDVPLRKMTREASLFETYDDVREYVPKSERKGNVASGRSDNTSNVSKKPSNGNYSGNRKF